MCSSQYRFSSKTTPKYLNFFYSVNDESVMKSVSPSWRVKEYFCILAPADRKSGYQNEMTGVDENSKHGRSQVETSVGVVKACPWLPLAVIASESFGLMGSAV